MSVRLSRVAAGLGGGGQGHEAAGQRGAAGAGRFLAAG